MAYGDYGAYIWKNGKNITAECADTHYVWNGKEFIKEGNCDEKSIIASGHAVICLGDLCVEFFKVYNPRIIYSTGKKVDTEIITENKDYINIRRNLQITGYSLGNLETIYLFEVRYKKDYYCVVFGSQVGNGLDETKTSKYILKNMKFNKSNNRYYIDTEGDTDIDIVVDKLQRLEKIKFVKYLLKRYGLKPLFADLLRFNFKGAKYYWSIVKENLITIKWLK